MDEGQEVIDCLRDLAHSLHLRPLPVQGHLRSDSMVSKNFPSLSYKHTLSPEIFITFESRILTSAFFESSIFTVRVAHLS